MHLESQKNVTHKKLGLANILVADSRFHCSNMLELTQAFGCNLHSLQVIQHILTNSASLYLVRMLRLSQEKTPLELCKNLFLCLLPSWGLFLYTRVAALLREPTHMSWCHFLFQKSLQCHKRHFSHLCTPSYDSSGSMYPMNVKRAWGVIRGLIHICVSEVLSQPPYCNLPLLQFYSYQVKAGDNPLFQTQSTHCHL